MQNQLDEEIKYNSINLFNFFIEIPKIVFSKTLDKSQWINIEIAKGDFQTEITRIKNQQGMDIIVYGGASFDSSLIKEMLIDEFLLFINPVAIGNGMRIYSKT
jgi:dihydrofolate reductase